MCILFFAINQHPKYPLVVCANRDEFHLRETQSMHWWQSPAILAGKDLQAGGTWLGVNKAKKFAALTNYRSVDIANKHVQLVKPSRGELVTMALSMDTQDFEQYLDEHGQSYAGFNIVYGDVNGIKCFDNKSNRFVTLNNGFHALCNGAIDDIWPKMAKGVNALSSLVASEQLSKQALLALMTNKEKASIEELPETGIGIDWEHLLSSIFIVSPEYGTRSTSILTIDDKNNLTMLEQSYDSDGEVTSATNLYKL
ncbi:NRDE family protein [Thalassotalea agarivorans]|uniref:Uncharacterized conserved protein, contains NRDE domain n=1 Tax=Thalassotalea agarivorans TaxID=349064 RepID=A0A1H9YQH7_THASX|nr:NRDE family protein [Thalassotalea agarivorans]SES71332.1 Uncharacterized conserved protein, contains NRDE domain [Thalassotalea agarivorans]